MKDVFRKNGKICELTGSNGSFYLILTLEDLVERMESSFADGWKTNEIPRSEITRRFSGIAGFRMRVSRIEAKFKLGQDEPLRDALAIADVLETHAALEDQKLATLIRKQNSGRAI